jgi:hypothetical protein
MMKQSLYRIGASALLVTIILPSISFAEMSDVSEKSIAGSQFCKTITNREQELNTKIDDKKDKLEITRHDRLNKKSADRAERDAKLSEHRQDVDSNRDDQVKKLETKATTDAQKAAVVEFKQTLTTALATRRAAVDAAITGFRADVDRVTTNRNITVDTAIKNLQSARQVALDKAKSDCAAGMDGVAAKANFEASMKTAQTAFQTAKSGFIKKDEVTTAATNRKIAITKAMDDFKTTMTAAQVKLKAAFTVR